MRDFCAARGAWASVVSRIDGLDLVHLGQLGDDPGLKLGPKLDEQFLHRLRQVVAGLRQVLQGVELVVGGGLGRGLRQVPLGLLHRAAGADQVFLEGDPRVAEPGRDLAEGVGRGAVAGLVLLEPAELGLGRAACSASAIRPSSRSSSFLKRSSACSSEPMAASVSGVLR